MRQTALFLILSFLCACTQQPAPVAHRGGEYFGRNGASAGGSYDRQAEPRYYPPDSPKLKEGYATQSVPATAGSVGVSDLPPVESKPLPPAKPQSSLPKESPDVAEAKPLKPLAPGKMAWPVEGRIISRFGIKGEGRINDGINIEATEGEPIYAAADGIVTYTGNALRGYGTMALIKHSDNLITTYAHASDIVVKKGDTIRQGQVIGHVGRTGGVATAQLHFSVRESKTPVDPLRYLG